MKIVHIIAFILLVVGGLNWGLYAFHYNLVDSIFQGAAMYVYILVGLAAIWEVATHAKNCRTCKPGSMPMAQ